MAKTYLGMLLALLHAIPTHAIPWQEAPSTVPVIALSPTSTPLTSPEIPPLPTPPPQIRNGTLEAPNICGYVNRDFENPYTCDSSLTCLWNSLLHIVACGSPPSSITFHTHCIPNRFASSCSTNSTCISDSSILHCPSETPHCATARIGPASNTNGEENGNYSIRACQVNPVFGKLRVELDYAGQSVLGHLPRFLGGDGIVRYGTVTPSLLSPPASSSTTGALSGSLGNGGINAATVPGGVFSVIVSSLPSGDRDCNSTCREERYEKAVRRQVLAGGLVGGCMVLLGVGFGAWVVWAWKRKARREGENGEFVMQDVGGVKIERVSTVMGEEGRDRTRTLEDT